MDRNGRSSDQAREENGASRGAIERRTVLKRTALGVSAVPLGAGRQVGLRRGRDALALGEGDDSDTGDGDDAEESSTAYQIDLAFGEPIEDLGEDDGSFYARQENRLVQSVSVTEGGERTEAVRYREGERESPYADATVSYGLIEYDEETNAAAVDVSASEDAEESARLTLAGYELPDGETTFSFENADEQELLASRTVVLESDEETTLAVDLDGGDEDDDEDVPEYTRDEISRTKYDREFEQLSAETSGQVEELFNRQHYDDELELGDLRTREEIAAERFGRRPEELSRESRIAVEDVYRGQFKCPKSGFGHGLGEIARAKYDREFEELSDETAAAVYEIRHRQPFLDGAEPEEILTRDEISRERHGRDFDELSKETTVEVQHAFDWQFACTPIGNENEE